MKALDAAWLAEHPLPEIEDGTDKNRRGRLLIAGGSAQVPGALRLTGEAAFRMGAGKVQLATIERAAIALGIAMPEAGVFALPEHDSGEIDARAGELLRERHGQCDALVIGPGMGAEAPAAALLGALLPVERPLLLDAAMLAGAPACRRALVAGSAQLVLTPHPGEMARLMDCDEAVARDDPVRVAEEAAQRFGAVVVLKASETHVAAPGMETLRYPGGGVGLATGGSGDVLAGAIGGLLARGIEPFEAAAWGVWLHGEAGRRLGPPGFLARELLAELKP